MTGVQTCALPICFPVTINRWNKEAAAQSQEYAKEMFDYTGYENQVKQMKAAGLNPAILNGGAGSAVPWE